MPSRPFIASRIEDRLNRLANRFLGRRGWQESIVAFTGYGTTEQLRVLARVGRRGADAAQGRVAHRALAKGVHHAHQHQ